MTTLTRLAGMADVPSPTGSADPEAQTTHTLTNRPSRSSLPPSRRPSHRSTSRGSRSSSVPSVPPLPDLPAPEEEPWGPRHPCFPHPNPHAPRGSPEAASTRVIRVPRDWLAAGDQYPALTNVYPEILDGSVSEAQFRELVLGLNERLRTAFEPGRARAVGDALLGVVTGWVWDDLGFTGPKAGVRELERFVDEWNAKRERQGSAARAVQLRRTGYMNLDIVIPDPQIDGQ